MKPPNPLWTRQQSIALVREKKAALDFNSFPFIHDSDLTYSMCLYNKILETNWSQFESSLFAQPPLIKLWSQPGITVLIGKFEFNKHPETKEPKLIAFHHQWKTYEAVLRNYLLYVFILRYRIRWQSNKPIILSLFAGCDDCTVWRNALIGEFGDDVMGARKPFFKKWETTDLVRKK